MNAPLWFSNLAFWSLQVALLILSGGLLLRVFQIQQPRIVLVCWRVLLAIILALPFIQPWRRPRSVEAITLSSANTGAPVTHVTDATAFPQPATCRGNPRDRNSRRNRHAI